MTLRVVDSPRIPPWLALAFLLGCAAGCSGHGWDGMEPDAGDGMDAGPDGSSPPPVDAAPCSEHSDAADEHCGELQVNGELNQCAQITGYELSPLSASIGGEVNLHAQVEDLENDPVSFTWTAAVGSFSEPEWPSTRYRCDAAGDFMVRLTVSDSPGCVTVEDIPVSCTAQP